MLKVVMLKVIMLKVLFMSGQFQFSVGTKKVQGWKVKSFKV